MFRLPVSGFLLSVLTFIQIFSNVGFQEPFPKLGKPEHVDKTKTNEFTAGFLCFSPLWFFLNIFFIYIKRVDEHNTLWQDVSSMHIIVNAF